MLKFNRPTAYALATAWLMLSFYLLTLPGSSLPTVSWLDAMQADKVVHILLFGVLVWCWYLPFKPFWGQRFLKSKALLVAFLAFHYGVVMEFVQKWFIPNRSFDGWDIVADGIGCALAYLLLQRHIKSLAPSALENGR
jgi:hypothetical protein